MYWKGNYKLLVKSHTILHHSIVTASLYFLRKCTAVLTISLDFFPPSVFLAWFWVQLILNAILAKSQQFCYVYDGLCIYSISCQKDVASNKIPMALTIILFHYLGKNSNNGKSSIFNYYHLVSITEIWEI